MEVPGVRGRGRPKKTWMDSVKTDMKNWKMPPCADDRFEWRSTMNSNMQLCNPHLNGKKHDYRINEKKLNTLFTMISSTIPLNQYLKRKYDTFV